MKAEEAVLLRRLVVDSVEPCPCFQAVVSVAVLLLLPPPVSVRPIQERLGRGLRPRSCASSTARCTGVGARGTVEAACGFCSCGGGDSLAIAANVEGAAADPAIAGYPGGLGEPAIPAALSGGLPATRVGEVLSLALLRRGWIDADRERMLPGGSVIDPGCATVEESSGVPGAATATSDAVCAAGTPTPIRREERR